MKKISRTLEECLMIPVLMVADSKPDGFVTTTELISELEGIFNLTEEDVAISAQRSDTKFSQIVRNVISHRTTSKNIIGRGLADYISNKKGIQITVKGREMLKLIKT